MSFLQYNSLWYSQQLMRHDLDRGHYLNMYRCNTLLNVIIINLMKFSYKY